MQDAPVIYELYNVSEVFYSRFIPTGGYYFCFIFFRNLFLKKMPYYYLFLVGSRLPSTSLDPLFKQRLLL